MVQVGSWLKLSFVVLGATSISSLEILSMYSRSIGEEVAVALNYTGNASDVNETYTTLPSIEGTTTSEGSSCRKVMMILAKRLMKHLNACGKELKQTHPEKEDFQKHFQCTIRCFMQRVQLVDQDFRMSAETAEFFLTHQIPERFQELMRRIGTPCVIEFAPKLDAGDEYCLQYGEYLKCVQNAVSESC